MTWRNDVVIFTAYACWFTHFSIVAIILAVEFGIKRISNNKCRLKNLKKEGKREWGKKKEKKRERRCKIKKEEKKKENA